MNSILFYTEINFLKTSFDLTSGDGAIEQNVRHFFLYVLQPHIGHFFFFCIESAVI